MQVFISSHYRLNTCIYTIILVKTPFQKSKTRLQCLIFYNNYFAALQDHSKVFRLSKNNFLDNFSFIAEWKWISSFFYNKQTFWLPQIYHLDQSKGF